MTHIAVVGDYSDSVTAHVAINASLTQLTAAAEGRLSHEWVPTPDAETVDFEVFDGVWCTPASPYASERGALRAITHARAHH